MGAIFDSVSHFFRSSSLNELKLSGLGRAVEDFLFWTRQLRPKINPSVEPDEKAGNIHIHR